MITLCIPTKDRPLFLSRLLHYYARTHYQHWMFIGDSSGPANAQRNQRTIASFNGRLNISYWNDPSRSSCAFLEQMSQHLSTPYCAFVGDDDFLCTPALDQYITFLEHRPEYSAVHGRGLMLQTEDSTPYGSIRSTKSYPQAILRSDTGAERLKEFFTVKPNALLYSVHRTGTWRDMFRGLSAMPGLQNQNIFKDELIPTAVSVIRGKVKELEGLYLIRHMHDGIAWHPHVYDWVTDPIWFPSFQVFRDRVVEELQRQDGISQEDAEVVFRQSFWLHLAREVTNAWRKQQIAPARSPSKLRAFAKRLPGLRSGWRRMRSAIERYRTARHDREGFSLTALLRPSSPFHADFMPIYELITLPPNEVSYGGHFENSRVGAVIVGAGQDG